MEILQKNGGDLENSSINDGAAKSSINIHENPP